MTNEQRIELIKTGTDKQEHLMQLFEQNKGLIFQICLMYKTYETVEDLMQIAFIGLIQAVEHYEPQRSQFITVLPLWVKSEIHKHIYLNQPTHVPVYLQQLANRYKRLQATYERNNKPLTDDVATRRKVNLNFYFKMANALLFVQMSAYKLN